MFYNTEHTRQATMAQKVKQYPEFQLVDSHSVNACYEELQTWWLKQSG